MVRQINWSGYIWNVVTDGFGSWGNNHFSDSTNNVWIDSQGNLHLKITYVNGTWYCSEVTTTNIVGPGTYTVNMVTNPLNPAFDKYTVAGIFYYLDDFNELDIEYSRWDNASNNNLGQFTVQNSPAVESPTFYINNESTNNKFIWFSDGKANFEVRDSLNNILSSWQYPGAWKTKAGGVFIIDLWLHGGNPPSDGKEKELVLSSFNYTPTSQVPLGSIGISPLSANVNIGNAVNISALCKDQNGTTMVCPTLTWSSSNTTIATVSTNGTVTGVATGSVNVIAASGTVQSNLSNIIVTPSPVINQIQLSLSIKIGATKQLTARCLDNNNNVIICPTLTWASDNKSVATVNSSGLVKGISRGTANITASTSGITGNKFIITVTT